MDNFPPRLDIARMYGGMVHGTDALGITDIEFPDMKSAASWAAVGEIAHRVMLRADQSGKRFGETVVVQLLPE
jgi:hypothetical protein